MATMISAVSLTLSAAPEMWRIIHSTLFSVPLSWSEHAPDLWSFERSVATSSDIEELIDELTEAQQ